MALRQIDIQDGQLARYGIADELGARQGHSIAPIRIGSKCPSCSASAAMKRTKAAASAVTASST